MCLGLPALLVGGLQIAGGMASYFAQSAYAKARQNLENQMAERNYDLARRTAIENYRSLDDRELQVGAKIAEQIREVTRQGQTLRGTASVAAASAGVTGRSVDEVLNQFEQRQLEYVNTAMQNKAFQRAQIESEKKGAQMTLEGRLLQSAPDLIQQPNFFASALGSFANAFSSAISVQSNIDPSVFGSGPVGGTSMPLAQAQLNYGAAYMGQFTNPMNFGGLR
jgi:hypothetical protein